MRDLLFRTWPKTGDLGIVSGIDDIPNETYCAGLTEGYGNAYTFLADGTFGSLGESIAAVRNMCLAIDAIDPETYCGISFYTNDYYKIENIDDNTYVVDFGDPCIFGRIVRSKNLSPETLFE